MVNDSRGCNPSGDPCGALRGDLRGDAGEVAPLADRLGDLDDLDLGDLDFGDLDGVCAASSHSSVSPTALSTPRKSAQALAVTMSISPTSARPSATSTARRRSQLASRGLGPRHALRGGVENTA
eukprot:2654594-Pleurochrysis_carterae.AAC.3